LKNEAFFYILKESDKFNITVCQIIKYFYKKKSKILLTSQDNQFIKDLDDLLWTFEQISFIPHSTYGSFDELSPVFLCNKDLLPHSFDLSSFNTLFNLDGKIPSDYQHFKKIVEFVRPQENYRTKSREHYLFYKKNNFVIKHETI
tara:strand:- start:887 stop:1321 length:435 start_codon:yes stop_codon:yes gene_type:complete